MTHFEVTQFKTTQKIEKKNCIAQKLPHGLRALGRAMPQALRALGNHYRTPWPVKPVCTGGASYVHIVHGGAVHPSRAHTVHTLCPLQERRGDHPARAEVGDRHPQSAQSLGP